jgi:hypothetical protein
MYASVLLFPAMPNQFAELPKGKGCLIENLNSLDTVSRRPENLLYFLMQRFRKLFTIG